MNEIPAVEDEFIAAAEEGNFSALQELLDSGASVNSADNNGWTALMSAVDVGRESTIAFLLERGADVNHQDRFGQTALMRAVESGNNAIVKALIASAGVSDINPVLLNSKGKTIFDLVKNDDVRETLAELESRQLEQRIKWPTPLPVADVATKCHSSLGRDHSEHGTDGMEEKLPLDSECGYGAAAGEGNRSTVSHRNKDDDGDDHGDDNNDDDDDDSDGIGPLFTATALIEASEEGDLFHVRSLLTRSTNDIDVDVNVTDPEGYLWTPLMAAAGKNHAPVVKLLLQHGARVDMQDKFGQTALMQAVLGGNCIIARMLLEADASMDIQNHANKSVREQSKGTEMNVLLAEFQHRRDIVEKNQARTQRLSMELMKLKRQFSARKSVVLSEAPIAAQEQKVSSIPESAAPCGLVEEATEYYANQEASGGDVPDVANVSVKPTGRRSSQAELRSELMALRHQFQNRGSVIGVPTLHNTFADDQDD